MIDYSKLEGFSEFKVVRERELRGLHGWTLIAVLTTDELVAPPQPGCGYNDPNTGAWMHVANYDTKHAVPLVTTVTTFLLGKRRDEELAELRKCAETASENYLRACTETDELRRVGVAVTKERDDLRTAAETLGAQVRAALDDARIYRDKSRRMEADLAKVRREVGEKEWKRIIGGEEKPHAV